MARSRDRIPPEGEDGFGVLDVNEEPVEREEKEDRRPLNTLHPFLVYVWRRAEWESTDIFRERVYEFLDSGNYTTDNLDYIARTVNYLLRSQYIPESALYRANLLVFYRAIVEYGANVKDFFPPEIKREHRELLMAWLLERLGVRVPKGDNALVRTVMKY